VEERRSARIGTVSGLAVLAGGTAVAAVAGGTHSVFATILHALLTLGLGHSLIVEIKRQARRRSPAGWHRHDTINSVLLAVWAEMSLAGGFLLDLSGPLRAVTFALAGAYALACAYFVIERRRAIAARTRAAAFEASVAEQNMLATANATTISANAGVREHAEQH
jgi:hypothetical protein